MAFPATPLIDNFNRIDGVSLGAAWSGIVPNFSFTCGISGNRAAATAGDYGAAIFLTPLETDHEVFAEIPVLPTDNYSLALIFRCMSPSSAVQCYYIEYRHQVTGGTPSIRINRGFDEEALLHSADITLSPGDGFGARAIGDTLIAFCRLGGGDYQELFRITDATYSGQYIGLACLDLGDGRLDNFGGGSLITGGLSAGLYDVMESSHRTELAATVTVERWLPDWTNRITGLSGGATEQYAHGHAAAVAPNGSDEGEDIICRARSGSYASPQNGHLYTAIIRDSDLDDPTTWDTLWVDTGITGLMYPAWTANSGASHGGSIAVVHSGTNFRVFYLLASGDLRYVDVSYTGTVSGSTLIAALGTGLQLASMQIASCKTTEVFVLINQQVEASHAAWQPDVYGVLIRRYGFAGSWLVDNSFVNMVTHAEGMLLRDGPDQGNDFSNTSAPDRQAQWGKRFCGGLGVNEIDSNTVILSLGLTHWRKWGYDTHGRGIATFICYRNGWWERGPEADWADFNEDTQLHFPMFARACTVEGHHFIVWNRHEEPADYEQTATSQNIPRIEEVVYAKLSADGKNLTQFQYLGEPDDFTAAAIVVVNHGGVKKLYLLGWRSVAESPEAAYLCDVSDPQDLVYYVTGWNMTRNNRQGLSLDMDLSDPAILIDPDTVVKSGALARAYYGILSEQMQMAQAFIDLNTPDLSVDAEGQFDEKGSLNSRADLLLGTRAEQSEDILPLDTLELAPDSPMEHVTVSRGLWTLEPMSWPENYFSGQYTDLQGRLAWRLKTFPVSNLKENGVVGPALGDRWTDPGREWSPYIGSWFKNMCELNLPATVDGIVEASVRFGQNGIQDDVSFQSNYRQEEGSSQDALLYATVAKTNGVVTTISFSAGGFGGGPFWYFGGWDGTPYPQAMPQYAVMAGLVCRSPELARKYMFIWEHDSRFATSSHTHGPWNGEQVDSVDFSAVGTGSNMLYLVETDYSGDNWLAVAVAGVTATGLTPGQPADLRMQVLGGTIYCYYRAHSTGTPNQWRFAFSYKAGRFGPGLFGLIGRGHSPQTWASLSSGLTPLTRLFNVVDFWNIRVTDAQRDRTLEDHLKRFCWRGFTPTTFETKVDEAARTVNSGATYNYGQAVENLTIDFKLSLPANGNEAGVFLRGVNVSTPTDECIRLGLVAHSTANSAASAVNYYVVKRRYLLGSEVTTAREYAPLPLQLSPNVTVPVRVVVRGPVYLVWVAGHLGGVFIDTTALGLYFGLYAQGGNAPFTSIYVPELYEVIGRVNQEMNQTMDEAIRQVIGRRRIKSVFDRDGSLKFSYFEAHPTGPDFPGTRLWQSSVQRNGRYFSKVKVQGTNAEATYQSATLARRGQRFQVVNNSDIVLREFAYREARAIVAETAEQQQQATFEGLPDLRVSPEDIITITVARQNIAGQFIVDDFSMKVTMSEEFNSTMTLSTRQTVAL